MKELIREILSESEEADVVSAIAEAERMTSGEIRVHLCSKSEQDVLKEAERQFLELGMDKTEARNGVLIYVAVQSHSFAIIGDQGINEKVPEGFWESTRDVMSAAFRQGRFAEGLIAGVLQAGSELKEHFPILEDDENELSNEISY